jgi:putative PIN family toxin of toxin-antitoxin system
MPGENKKKGSSGLKVVLDTNVYISAFNYPKGILFPIWQHARLNTYELFLSPSIVNETGRVLRDDFAWDEGRIRSQLKELSRVGEITAVTAVPNVIKHDPMDNQILGCALASKAHVIVTGDQDLLRLKEYEGIRIVSPIDFLHTLAGYPLK